MKYVGFRIDNPTQDLHITDDFGQHADIRSTSIHGIMIEDLNETKLVAVEMMLHDARVRATAQQRAQSDTQLRATQRGPSVLTPMSGMNGS